MRTRNSILNIISNCFCFSLVIITGLIVRRVFADNLGMKYLGVSGRFTDYVTMLTIFESGLGMNLVCKLYDPISKKNWQKISLVISLIKKSYIIISILVIIFGIPLCFFAVNSLQEGFDKGWLIRIFFLHLTDVICSYVYNHKKMMLVADQKARSVENIRSVCLIFLSIIQIFILKFFKSFELFILAKIVSRLSEAFASSFVFRKNYKNVNTKNKLIFDNYQKKEIFSRVKSSFFHKIGEVGLGQIPTLIFTIVPFSVYENAIYYNYILIVKALLGISMKFFSGITASFGDLLNSEREEKVEKNFDVIFLINFFIYSFFCCSFFCISNPFMKIWIPQENAIFAIHIVLALTINLYIYGMRQSSAMAKEAAGIYVQDRYFPIIEAIVNFLLSYFLSIKLGTLGVIIGSSVSGLIPVVTNPFFVYKIVFGKTPLEYYKKYFSYTMITAVEVSLCYYLTTTFIFKSAFMQLLMNISLCFVIPNAINVIVFCRTREFSHIWSLIVKTFYKIKKS